MTSRGRNVCSLMVVVAQVLAAFVVGLGYYLLAMAMTVYDGLMSMILQPIMGAVCTVVVIIMMLVIGLPIRLMKKLNRWWIRRWWLAMLLGALAFVMMMVSWMPQLRIKLLDPDTGCQIDSFHPPLAITGWMLTIFAVLHFFPPLPWRKINEES